jgi:hypothetical protein
MPSDLSSEGKVSSLWDENTVFFANPFSGRKKVFKSELKSSSDNTLPFY